MTSILIWAGLSSLAFMVFFGLAIMSILQKRPGMIIGAVVALLVALGAGIGAVVSLYGEEILPAPSSTSLRSGEEMYNSKLGAPVVRCVTVSHYRDRIVPAYEEFECVRAYICPAEMMRVTQQLDLEWKSGPSTHASRPPNNEGTSGDFAPEALGDTLLACEGKPMNDGRRRWMYCARDSSVLVVVDWFQ